MTLKVYVDGNIDGLHRAMVAAPNLAEALRLIGSTRYNYRTYGGHVETGPDRVKVAMSEVGRVWWQKLSADHRTEPWVYVRHQELPADGIQPYQTAGAT